LQYRSGSTCLSMIDDWLYLKPWTFAQGFSQNLEVSSCWIMFSLRQLNREV